jgi:uncharacterized membrane protein
MISAEASVVVNRPIDEVFDVLIDPSRGREWQGGLVEAELLTDPPVATGSQARYVIKIVGREMDSEIEWTEITRPNKIAWQVIKAPIPGEGSHTLSEVEGGTQIVYEMSGEPGGFFKLAAGMVQKNMQKELQEDLNRLKALLEGD